MSSDSPIISLTGVSKSFKMYEKPIDRLKQSILRKKTYREFWSLKNITMSLHKGQTIGIIGKNGSGKSTLLQIIAQTLQPTEGEVSINGRIAALLELGSGFNPEFTGRENVIMNGAINGFSPTEIKDRMESIEQFADIGEFIDQPVKTYSSGMFVRLAFSCAIHVNPDILIVDEALAVGDMQFQLKCIEKMKTFKNEGKTILFVSHDGYSIRNFCDEAIWMIDGQIHQRGDANTVTKNYEDFMKFGLDSENKDDESEQVDNSLTHVISIDKVEFKNKEGIIKKEFEFDEDIFVELSYRQFKKQENIVGGIALFDRQGTYICGLNTKLDKYPLPEVPGEYKLILKYEQIKLLPGTYSIDVGFFESSGLVRLDYKARYESFRVSSNLYFAEGLTFINHKWDFER
ncbi:ABC transporter ATP-binding protein [Bacillus sp. FJAT-26390]|uniref:ABC transporter ATP-binding protein n=1 Tax=Bacillus sp. FJAT-26390 TaxID=1743142 RepID=UPI0008080C4C|nr:ABC transporter ATP-binding protein [Bacillus sp. FJAT-26390]OBZ13452.1 ABC transporter [Bacillus sp. FJAT-26390]